MSFHRSRYGSPFSAGFPPAAWSRAVRSSGSVPFVICRKSRVSAVEADRSGILPMLGEIQILAGFSMSCLPLRLLWRPNLRARVSSIRHLL